MTFPTETTMTNQTISDDDEKCTKEYFEKRIQTLQDRIRKAVPAQDVLDPSNTFPSIMQSLESSMDSLKAATDLLDKLQKEKDSIDPSVIDQAKDAVSKAQETVTKLNDTATTVGCQVIEAHELLYTLQDCCVHRDLLECTVLVQATPTALAEWCAQDPAQHGALWNAFVQDLDQIRAVLLAGGPSRGLYGPALVLRHELQTALEVKCGDRSQQRAILLDRLALAVALEHASPIAIMRHSDQYVDPMERFWHFADAHEDGTLDEIFESLTVWQLRMVVDCDATHEDMTWGREFLKAYRPDEIWTTDEQWRYNRAVKTDVGYRHPDHEWSNYVDLISAGGECGARAWFGRFICKSWGVPTWGIRQPGHAAMTRYTTSKGWLICLGAPAWELSTWDDLRCGAKNHAQRHGNDFLEEAKARMADGQVCGLSYENVVLLECLADCFGERVEYGYACEKFWRSLSIAERKHMAQFEHSIGKNCGMKSDSTCLYRALAALGQNCDIERILVEDDGTTVIPAASFVQDSKFKENITVMDSFLGGKQIHFDKNCDGKAEYELPSNIPEGTYEVSLKLVNVHRDQKPMEVAVDSSCSSAIDSFDDFELVPSPSHSMVIPYTRGNWQLTDAHIEVDAKPGTKLQLSRKSPCWGLTVKEIVLKPKKCHGDES